jgi:hypothetical protein
MSLLKATLLDTGDIVTPAGRLMYGAFFEPRVMKGETDMSKAKYSATLLLPAKADLTAIEEAIEEASAGKKGKWRHPLLDTADNERLAEYAEEFPVFIRCNSKYRPDVIDRHKESVRQENESDEVYNGRWARFTVRPFFYDAQMNKGVSLGLQNVQLLQHDEVLAGGRISASSQFDAVEEDSLEDML